MSKREKLKSCVPGAGKTTTQQRLDELFNRKTLGSVVFGSHLNKIVEKVYNAIALVVVLTLLGVDRWVAIIVAVTLLGLWILGLAVVVYLFVRWERVEDAVADVAETADEVVSDGGTE